MSFSTDLPKTFLYSDYDKWVNAVTDMWGDKTLFKIQTNRVLAELDGVIVGAFHEDDKFGEIKENV